MYKQKKRNEWKKEANDKKKLKNKNKSKMKTNKKNLDGQIRNVKIQKKRIVIIKYDNDSVDLSFRSEERRVGKEC